jgi:signal transduction histidine kinase
MRRRLLLVIVGTVVVITVLAGAGTWLLAAQSTRTAAVSQARTTLQRFGKGGSGTFSLGSATSRAANLRVLVRVILGTARVDGATFLPIVAGALAPSTGSASIVPRSVLLGVAASPSVGAGSVVAGSTGSEAWAAEAVALHVEGVVARTRAVVDRTIRYVLVINQEIGSPSVSGEFLVLGGAVIAFAVIISLLLTRRITRPLRRAVDTTERIAAGDLDARVGAHPGDFPELRSLADSIDAMAEGLGLVRNAERQFLLSVSHELRTPLTSIRGYSEAILDGTAEDPARAAGVIGNEARRLERLVGDLLDLAKLDTRTFSFHFRVVDVGEVVEEVAEELRPVVDGAGLVLSVRAPHAPVFARVDPDRLDQVLANLVENASKYARSAVILGVDASGPLAVLAVEDDGPGIPPAEIGRIFDRHYSADRHARPGRPRGSGLGLAIASELSAAMGATVSAESPVTAAGGTRMVVRLPTVTPSQSPHTSHIGS